MVVDEQLQNILQESATAATACQKLVDLANENGGRDNITAIVSRFFEPTPAESRAFEAEVPLEDADVTVAPSSEAELPTARETAMS
jgi:hypothetical protein